ncbi:MAG: hypothetical protein AB7O88_04990 [Reyranellaceae bacterium]
MLVVGHNCPGCGRDTPSIACDACGSPVVWDRRRGSHCGACGLAASMFACPACGLSVALDKGRGASASEDSLTRALLHDDEGVPAHVVRPPGPPLRTAGIAVAAGLHGLVIAFLIGGHDGGRAPGRDVVVAGIAAAAVPDRLMRGAVDLPLDAKPVPFVLPPPGSGPPPPPQSDWVAPVVVTRSDRVAPPAPRNEGWLQRLWRSRRAYSPANDRFPADTAGIGG